MISNKDHKVVAACMIREMFGSVLRLSLENSIDLADILHHPLTLSPLSFCHVDGTMLKSPKSTLTKHLESKEKTTPPTSINVTIIDAMPFLQLEVNLPETLGELLRIF